MNGGAKPTSFTYMNSVTKDILFFSSLFLFEIVIPHRYPHQNPSFLLIFLLCSKLSPYHYHSLIFFHIYFFEMMKISSSPTPLPPSVVMSTFSLHPLFLSLS